MGQADLGPGRGARELKLLVTVVLSRGSRPPLELLAFLVQSLCELVLLPSPLPSPLMSRNVALGKGHPWKGWTCHCGDCLCLSAQASRAFPASCAWPCLLLSEMGTLYGADTQLSFRTSSPFGPGLSLYTLSAWHSSLDIPCVGGGVNRTPLRARPACPTCLL